MRCQAASFSIRSPCLSFPSMDALDVAASEVAVWGRRLKLPPIPHSRGPTKMAEHNNESQATIDDAIKEL